MKTKIAAFLLGAGSGLFSLQAMAAGEFTGQWTGEEKDQSTLTLQLKQTDNTITGSYCYITQNGNRIDCPAEGENNLKGTVNNHRARVEFTSSFGGAGYANLDVDGENMVWNKAPSSGEGKYYAPQHYTLTKKPQATASERRKFETDKFTVTLANKCGEFKTPCNNMFYLGVRKSDNSVITLQGKTVLNASGDVVGSEYKNGDVTYKVDYEPVKLTVSQKENVLIEQPGQWLK
ncbi:hypothetical protein ACP26F_13060 [Franconibacter pulveris 1160]|uniref:hypothetical protein n=1 Tax=Franconibacter pulveris TaxID=435910 RepID=UPI000463517D|nr:hypothetical protein [Franconibacter pulveris]